MCSQTSLRNFFPPVVQEPNLKHEQGKAGTEGSVKHTPDRILWARSGSGPVGAPEFDGTSDISCYDCGGTLKFTKAHTRRLGGVDVSVRCFFSHVSTLCGGESVLHKASKDVRGRSYFFRCLGCQSKVPINISGARHDGGERTVSLSGANYRPDIGFFDASGQLVGAVEVRHTHAISDEKARRYDEHDVVWVEVDAEEHLRAAEVSVLRCSYDRHGRRCDTCAEKQKEKERAQALEIRRADAEKAAEDAHLAKRLKLQSQYIPLVDQFLAFYDRTTGEKPSEQTIESFEDPDGVVPFKKHKGVHIDAVFKEDPQYVRWLVEKCETCPPKLLAKAQELLEGTCRRCFKEVDASWKTLCITCWRAKPNSSLQ
jgi:hypothetical protein